MGTYLCVTRRWYLVMLLGWHVRQSIDTLTLRNLHLLLCSLDASAWCDPDDLLNVLGLWNLHGVLHGRNTRSRPASAIFTLESQTPFVLDNGEPTMFSSMCWLDLWERRGRLHFRNRRAQQYVNLPNVGTRLCVTTVHPSREQPSSTLNGKTGIAIP